MNLLVLLGALLGALGPAGSGPPAPSVVVVATTRGQAAVPVSIERGFPVLPAPQLSALLPLSATVDGEWVVVSFADQPFRFLLNAPLYSYRGQVHPLVGGAYTRRDTTYIPLQWLTNEIPRLFSEGYRYDPLAARFEEARFSPVATGVPATPPHHNYREVTRGSAAERNGFRLQHKVVVDAGHGGADPGTLGRFLPRGVNEKHITLAFARELRDRLEGRGIDVVMTRNRDVAVDLRERAEMCRDDCGLFVSIHVNALDPAPGYGRVTGFETYFLSEALTAEAERVAAMENEALRYETDGALDDDDPLSFIFRDLHANEYLRESFLLAEHIQEHGAAVHPGADRGVSQAIFAVLQAASRPAVLIETGFSTNRGDAAFLASETGRRRLAEAIAEGIAEYLKQYENKVRVEGGG